MPGPLTGPAGSNSAATPPTQRTSDVIGTFRPVKQFKFSKAETAVTSLSFDDAGELLLAALSDETLQLYNCREGQADKTLLSKKYGCHLARFTHHAQSIVYASTKGDDTIRYLSTHDNQYLRYFKGHTSTLTSISMSPADDTFMSSALDNTVRLWNLQSPHAHGQLNLATPTLTAYDPSASVIAIASPATSTVLLYDVRNFEQAPFAIFDLRDELDSLASGAESAGAGGAAALREWTCLNFSNDGKHLLIGTNASAGHLLLDAFSGSLRALLVRHASCLPLRPTWQRAAPFVPSPSNPSSSAGGAPATVRGQGDVCLSPDARYAIGASGADRDAVVWDLRAAPDEETRQLRPLAALPCKTRAAVVEWNPRFNMLATGDRDVVMWLPDEHVGLKAPGDDPKDKAE